MLRKRTKPGAPAAAGAGWFRFPQSLLINALCADIVRARADFRDGAATETRACAKSRIPANHAWSGAPVASISAKVSKAGLVKP